ncbi:gliding motility-associated-like protein [Winogradskyella eximia]|uniref:Gliding motility-associated-like protein n=2 Tax=Winogradskyella eximia TaxID=262006 RepID=A0A3D9GQ43_9FLAO|nr:gliding motility-associated C-terminal domain-containing protein [Winogradskyella eximia]RED38585.1 gliding motility-associated-like protein [Winogradskyella eximia]
MKNNFTSIFFKLLTICVVSLLFIDNGFAQERFDKESDYWPKTAKLSQKERKDYMEVLNKRAKTYNENKSFSNYSQRSSETNPVGTCNVITCGSFNAIDISPNNNGLPQDFQTAVDGSAYAADIVYDCWNDQGTVDYSEGQYISYSNIDANIDTPAIISPSPDGGGFSIFSYKFEGIEQDLTVLPNATYRVCFEIAVIPRYSNSDGSFVEFSPDLNFGIGSGGIQITDPLTYNEDDLTVHPLTDFPNSLSTATTGPFQNPGGWTEINPYWETICITFQSDNSGTVNVFYQTQTPGKSVVLVDGLRLSLEGYSVPPTIAEENIETGNIATDVFCDSFSVDLNSYITSTGPGGSELTWSTSPDPLNTSEHLSDTVVSSPGTYYVSYYNPVDLCASPAGSINLMITDLSASVGSKSDANCVGDSNGSVIISATNGNPPYSYTIDGGSSQTSNTFNNLDIGNHLVEVTDSNNCSVSVNFDINVNDTEAPTASNLDSISVQCIDDVPEYNIEDVDDEMDNVTTHPVVSFISDVSNNLSCPETITRTYSVTDDCGNSINVTQLITINDTIPPTIDTPASEIMIECGVTPAGTLQNWLDTNGGAMASDNCGNITWSNNYNTGVSDCSESTTVIFTATDHCGNTATTRATYVIQDTTPPVITNVASNQSVECNIDSNATQSIQNWLDTNGGATATDDCSAIIWTNNFTSLSGGCGETGSATVTFTATDGCGNSTSTTATFNNSDTTNPVAPNAPGDLNLQCIDEVPSPGQLTATDNCMNNISATGVDNIDNSNPCNITIVRTWTFIDDCGNSSSVSQNITVADTTAPTFTVPADLNIECDVDANDLTITGDVTNEKDNCSSGLNATYTDSVANGSCANTETITRTWSLTDDCNNTTRHVQIINVVDTTAPTLTIPSNVTVECTDPTDPSATGTATGSDSCGNVTISYNDTSYANCGNTEKIKRTWTATDDCGNTRSRNQIITVKDTTPPTIDTPASPIMIECGVTPDGTLQAWLDNNGGAVASDNCGNVTWSNNYNAGISDCSSSITVIFTASDDCGNTSTTSATYTIQDTTPPVITISASDQIIECNIDSNATENIQNWLNSNGGATATDDCSEIIWTNNFTSLSGGCGETGSATVTFTATDGCGNSTTTTATFNNSDTTNPVAPNAPADSYFNCIDDVPTPGQLTATDNCMSNITVTGVDSVDNSNPCNITIVRTWTFIDDCGNSSSVSQNIIVADTVAPTFTVPADITIQCGEDTSSANTGDVTNEKDNCSSGLQATYTDSVTNGSCTNAETITRTWSLTDDCNNTTTRVQTISVVDTTAPTLNIPSDVTIECTNPTAPSATGTATGSDSCGNATITYNDSSAANCGYTETITRTWTATDDCGNTTSLDQIITIEDTTPPTMDTSASNIMIECGVTPSGTLQAWLDNNGGALASDNCGSVTWSNNYSDGVSDCSSSTTVIFTATDDCGNTSTTSAAYTIQDTTPPVITSAASDKTIECNIDSSSTQSIQNWLDTNGGATATDDCSTVIWSNNFTSLSGGCGETGSATVTFTATDGCGNSTSTTATFNNSDTTNPVPPSAPIDLTFQCIDEVPSPGQLTASDNCMNNISATGVDNIDNSNPCNIIIVRTWTFIDDCGNSSSVSQNITVADTTDPTFSAPADVTIECGVDTNDLTITGDVTNENDNCSSGLNATYSDSIANGSCANSKTITRTWSLTDDCNNTTTHVQTINVIDTTAPTFTAPADITIECDVDATDLAITGYVTNIVDNCSTNLRAIYTDTIADGSCANASVITRTWSLKDDCDNTTTLIQSITVQDTTAPIIDNTGIQNIEIQCGVTPDGTLENWLDNNAGATASDFCGNITWSNDYAMNTDVDCANGAITVIFTATDDCGNTATTSATYAIQDTTPPVITTAASDQTIECNIDGGVTEDFITWLATNGGANAADNCSGVIWSHNFSTLSDGCGETGSATVTFTATDGCGNSATTTATFNSVDTTNPVAPNAPDDLTFQCIDEVPNPGQLTASDNCMDNITVTGVDAIDNSDPCQITIVRTWTFMDDCGNSSSVSQNIIVADTTAPTITVPADITIQCGADESSANTGEATGSDNCNNLTITYSDTDTSSCGNTKTITRTWTVTDGCNNSVSDTQTINVIDTTDPSFNESLPTNITVDSNSIPTLLVLTASDNCDDNIDVIFSETLVGSNCNTSYTIERNWSAEDDCGNDIEHTQIINVNHTVLSITLNSKIDVNCFGLDTGAIDIDVNGGLPPYSYSWSNGATSQDLTDIGAGNYTITVEDNNGCTVSKSFYISEPATPLSLTIDKVNATSIRGCIDGTATANVSGGTSPYSYEWTSSANNQTTQTATNLPVGIHSVVVTDNNGCKTVESIEITCTDDCDTALTTGTTTNVLCFGDATGATSISASSVINPTATFTFTWSNGQTDTGVTSSAIADVIAGNYTVSVTMDGSVCEPVVQTITIAQPTEALGLTINKVNATSIQGCTDGTATPVVSGGTPPYTYLWSASANNQTTANASDLPVGDHTLVVTDANGCSTSQIISITCTDDCDTALTTGTTTNVLCFGDATGATSVSASSVINPTATFTFTWSNGQTDTGVTSSAIADVIAGNYTVSVTMDGSVCEPVVQTITIAQPSDELSGSITQIANSECNTENTGSLTAQGIGGTPPYTYSIDNGATLQLEGFFENLGPGTYPVLITDANGCTFIITTNNTILINDNENPTISVPNTLTISGCDIDVITSTNAVFPFNDTQYIDVTGIFDSNPNYNASDDFNISSITYIDTITSTDNCPIIISRTFTVTDNCNNSTTFVQTITVQDTTPPTIDDSAIENITIECGITLEATLEDWLANNAGATATDNCSTVTWTNNYDSNTTIDCDNGSIEVIFSATDECGNIATTTASYSLVDTLAPILTVPLNVTIECDEDSSPENTGLGKAIDECDISVEVTYEDIVETECGNTKTIRRVWTATDSCGNSATGEQIVTVEDSTAPTFTVPADITIECDVNIADLTLTGDVTDEADNCSADLEAEYADSTIDGNCPNYFVITRTWTLTDECDNVTTHEQLITVQDTTAPSFNETLPSDITVECDAVPEAETLTATDNCGTAEVNFVELITNGDCTGYYLIERRWTSIDSCDNVTEHTQFISVQDTTAPTVTTPFDENIIVACDDVPAVPSLEFEDSCSNNIEVVFDEESTQSNNYEDYNIIRTWTVSDDCGNTSEITQNIAVEVSNAITAYDTSRCILDTEFDLFDLLTGDFNMDGTWSVIAGDAVIDGSLFDPSSAEVGVYTFLYSITDGPCPTEKEVNVTLDDDCVVLACGEDDIVISKTVTANGDPYNEFFTISGVEDCEFVIELQIFNRWGAEIYKSNNYKNDWNGNAHSSSVGSSGKVPTGTYFYIINIRESGIAPITGPIYVATN